MKRKVGTLLDKTISHYHNRMLLISSPETTDMRTYPIACVRITKPISILCPVPVEIRPVNPLLDNLFLKKAR
jgi:hypothetical protein